MKDAAKLFAYFGATVLGGAILAPVLYWSAEALARRGIAPFLLQYEFKTFFHRGLLVCAVVLLWPLLRSLRIRSLRDLGLRRNLRAWFDIAAGFCLAVSPVVIAAGVLLDVRMLVLKNVVPWASLGTVLAAAAIVPLIEETFFRGLLLGVLLRAGRPLFAVLAVSAFFAVLHFLKPPRAIDETITWWSGFRAIRYAASSFADPIMLLAGFALLFLIGWILADARLRTHSLSLPIGLHAGWIFASGFIGKLTKGPALGLPWLGPNFLVGVIPVVLALITWGMVVLLYDRQAD